MAMAERERDHRHAMENKELNISLIGLIFGFIVALVALVAGAVLVYFGHSWAGTIIVGIDLVGLAGLFVLGSRFKRQEIVVDEHFPPEP